MNFKDGVYPQVISYKRGKQVRIEASEQIKEAMHTADALSKAIAGREIVVTAILDGKHKEGSKHYQGEAFDMRRWGYSQQELNQLLVDMKANLGLDYDVVLESTHVHIEYDPKNIKKK